MQQHGALGGQELQSMLEMESLFRVNTVDQMKEVKEDVGKDNHYS